MSSAHLIGVPLDLGAGRRGVDMGPSAIRIAGLSERLSSLGYSVTDRGDLVAPIPETRDVEHEHKKYIAEIAQVCQRVYETALESLKANAMPIVLGGDHSLATGSVAATADWARTTRRAPIGNVHGMPLAAILGQEPAELANIGRFKPKVRHEHTVLIGVRNLDQREKELVHESKVHVFTMKDIDRQGIAAIAEQALQLAGADTAGIHVSFDLDVCDPSIAPGVGTPVKGGLNYREAHLLMEIIADSNRLVALDLVEVNPTLDVRNATAQLGTELALSALGKKIL